MTVSNRLVLGSVAVVLVATVWACGSSSDKPGGSGGSGGATGGSGGANGGSGGSTDGGSPIDGSGGNPFADVNLDAPYQLPDGGCGQVFCPAVVAAKCQKGFQSLNDCANFCGQVAQTQCETQWNAVLTCAGPTPDISCDSSGQFTVNGCENEQSAFLSCAFADAG